MEDLVENFCESQFKKLFSQLKQNQKAHFVDCMILILQSHRYKKGEPFTEGRDFSIVRDPMYKFSNEAKERFFNNIYMAFLFHYFVREGAKDFFLN